MNQTMTFAALRAANVARLPRFKNRKGEPAHSQPDGSDWALSTWSNAVLGELGELANLIKKVERGDLTLDEARAAAPFVDALLLDSGNPALAVKELGGTGRTHDWAFSRRIRDAVFPLPLWLAGGLRAHNVAAAVAAVQPHGLDLCTGVRSEGRLDGAKLAAFMHALAHGAQDADQA